jgi:hypothetical protein
MRSLTSSAIVIFCSTSRIPTPPLADCPNHVYKPSHYERGRTNNDIDLPPEFSAGMVAGYRAKNGAYHFHLAMQDDVPVAGGSRWMNRRKPWPEKPQFRMVSSS